MKSSFAQINLQFYWLQWTVVTLAGFLLSLIWLEIGEPPDLGTLQGTIGGTIIGLSQALILSRWLPQAWLWILATLIAWGLLAGSQFGAIGWVAPRTDLITVRLTMGIILGGMTGLWVGFWQWLVIKQAFDQSYRWILMSGFSWAVGLSLGWIIGGFLRSVTHLFLGEVVGLAIAWMLVGLQTGLTLALLLKKNV
ncbi:hypothetical protein VB715_02280 [Crocosphaera sp. UHCC 0190]|uniref:hypothetical protein n=1 Tax=Crocosphaera sp. UHCC 0190 TaxID=3110246 RepID=UPI002B1E9768|nr:hypothetical protein [Crocosphaera sp. UHCC 0190]MEA5508583.1 hypothetical protein [Crocosphaera sp. UHCC 0190]